MAEREFTRKDWHRVMREARARITEDKIKDIRRNYEINERLVSAIETPDVVACGADPKREFVNGKVMALRGFSVHHCDACHRVEVGVHDKGSKKDVVSVRIALSNDVARAHMRRSKHADILSLTIEDDEALDEAIAIYHGIYLILKEAKNV